MNESSKKPKPVRKFRSGLVSAAVWENTIQTDDGHKTVQTITFQRSYKDAETGQWKNSDDDKTYFGLVAQDVEKVLPEVVSTPADGSPGMGLSCTGLNAVTIEAIKELKRLVESQQQRVKTQQIQISQMKADIARLRRAVARK